MTNFKPWIEHYPEGIEWEATIPNKTLIDMLQESIERTPKRTCIDFLGNNVSYQEIGKQVDKIAAGLQQSGFNKGDKVALLLPNCPLFIAAYFGVLKAGGIVVNCNPLYAVPSLVHQIKDSASRYLFTIDVTTLFDKAAEILKETALEKIIVGKMASMLPFPKNLLYPLVKSKEVASLPNDHQIVPLKRFLGKAAAYKPVTIDPEQDIAVLQYTGGTTGTPKAAVLTHRNLYANTYQCSLWFHKCKIGEEVIMGVLPFFHVFAMTVVMNLGVMLSMTIIAHPRFNLLALLKDVVAKKPTLMPGVPSMFVAINHFHSIKNYDLSSVNMCISGGASLPLEVKQKFETLTGCVLVEGYGLSETSPVACANPLFGNNKAGSVGLPFPGTDILIEDPDNRGTFLKQGEIGEICIKGPQVMKEYWQNKEETEIVFKDEFLRTGDLGYLDEEGYVFIKDRLKEMIISGGYNVYPRTIEEILYQHPSIAEAAAIGIPDEFKGQKVKVVLALKDGKELTAEQVKDYLKDKIAKFSMPKEVEFRESLPKTLIGKISKKDL